MKPIISAALVAAMALSPLGVGSVADFSFSDYRDLALQSLIANAPTTNVVNTTDSETVGETWTLDKQTVKGGETLEAADGWLHFQSGSDNGNSNSNADQYPAVAVSDVTYDFTKAGSYHAAITSPQAGSNNRFGFYLGYTNPGSGLFIGYDAGGWFWQRYGGDDAWYSGTRIAAPSADVEVTVDITWDGSTATLTVDGQKAFDVDYSSMLDIMTGTLAMKAGTYGGATTDVYLQVETEQAQTYALSGKVVDAEGAPVSGAVVRVSDQRTTTGDDGLYSFEGLEAGEYTITVGKDGFDDASKDIQIVDTNLVVDNITLQKAAAVETETLKTAAMKVEVKKNFPAVLQYTMTNLDNRVMYGQSKDVRTVTINGTDVELTDGDVTFKKVSDTEATYELAVKNAEKNIDAVLTVQIKVEANTLDWNITKIENKAGDENPVQTVSFPNLSLVSVRSTQDGAQFTGARMSSDTNINGDTNYAVTDDTTANSEDYTYAFVSGGSLSAGLWSNSEHDGTTASETVAGGAKNTRVVADTQNVGSSTSLGLSSAEWYYQRVVSDSHDNTYTVDETDMPKMSVAIAGDENEDGSVNWEDGAIVYRDIMNNPYKSEEVPELVAYRIAMNFGSQAQNPFLTTLDNVKKVALNTDGLGQSVLLKGYANEGHDSGHPDYGDIGERIGGAEDMNTLMEEGAEYGARFGIHINASEMYPEADAFSDNLVRRNASGGLAYGWNWLDQGVGIDGIYDLASGEREDRLSELKSEVGDNLDFIYLDVWGNQTSGAEDSWETRKMSQMVNENGWRMANEWGAGNEYDATFQHWAADLTYGGSTMKGENSQVMRFLRNHQKDSWVGDYPSYGGAADAPLLGGYNMKDFEGWQGRNDYDAYITNLYTHDVSTKFIQHFKVTQWVNSPLDATSVQDASVNNGNEQITLKDDDGNVLVLSRESNDSSSAAYRNRTITLNGKVVASGAVSKGDTGADGTESYLLPWLWDAQTGESVSSDDEKLYHWNTNGGTTTWDLPEGWKNLANVKVYKLTDLGKTDEQTVQVVNGQVTLTADAQTPYVVYKGDASPKQIQVTWSEGMHLVDAGFNGGEESLDSNWTISGDGTASIAKSQYSNPMLKLTGTVQATQKLTDLTAGKEYALYVGVDNRSDGDATVTVTSGNKVLATDSTARSIAKNYVKAYSHSNSSATVDGSSYFQNMYVFFTVPESGEVTLTLSHEKSGDTYFDDVRVVENSYKGLTLDEDGEVVSLTNGFENNAQGIWPFVVSGSEGVEDNRIHLSELHDPYTQSGWDVKKMDDVLDGTWSVKVNGLTQKNTLVYQTIPQNITFEAGEQYKISFDYQSGSDGTYAVAVGQGEFSAGSAQITPLDKALGEDGHYEFTLTGGLNNDSWFGIYSTATAPDTQGTSGSAADFGGYKDFVLDNLKIERIDSETKTKAEVEAKYEEVTGRYDGQQSAYSDEAWQKYQDALVEIRVLINKTGATEDDYTKAFGLLTALEEYMATAPGTESSDAYDISTDHYTISTGSYQDGAAGEGPAGLAFDGDASTHWHTSWYANAVQAGASWIQIDLNKAATVSGLRYLPRSGAANANGKIKKATLTITTADDATQTVEAEFSTDTKWQKVTFEKPIENVTSVRLLATETTGQSDAEANKYAAAAELRLTSDERTTEPPATTVDTTELQAAVTAAEALTESDYTADSWASVQTALAAAKAVLDNADATAYDVALALANLNDAVDALQPVVDKSALQEAVTKAEALTESDYTADSWAAFQNALAAAKAVLADADATSEDVATALADLNAALQGLKPVEEPTVDKSALQEAVTKAEALSESLYTADSWAKFQNALAAANVVLADADATSDDVAAALADLNAAMEALQPADSVQPSDPEQPGDNDQPQTPGESGLSNTGSSIALVAVGGLMLLAAGVALLRRRGLL